MSGTQLSLLTDVVRRTRGGARPNAGRKPGVRPRARHRARPEHDFRHPVHVTLRVSRGLPSFRSELLAKLVENAVRSTRRDDFQIVEYSIQSDHVHAIVEASDKRALERGMKSFTVRVSRRLKKLLGLQRAGIWSDRYHRRDFTSPRQVRNGLVYVIANYKKHHPIPVGVPQNRAKARPPLESRVVVIAEEHGSGWRG
ncbi:transposase [Labilithrix luteola]|uniref:transposase n=1 Tax=Labilithrix luteola TaxID=1391654 RepID=UPI0011BA7E4C|nr:transposase [Labilithrix luteola]